MRPTPIAKTFALYHRGITSRSSSNDHNNARRHRELEVRWLAAEGIEYFTIGQRRGLGLAEVEEVRSSNRNPRLSVWSLGRNQL
ncbi:MAG: hypothetical protein Ct9H300mP11_17720 [Chloroflexota bacterium]|nr:MAG: hypothetical protein Ct9H300mP11_17720 [Chloroflexota bacterium]